ncbi:MAG: hypothetical protein EU532_08605 [Promethearchaeota archaeon]|nr:MAG: hypothetical protein EU532_08605 [Candidatus Lokiarchaeota archaeon]
MLFGNLLENPVLRKYKWWNINEILKQKQKFPKHLAQILQGEMNNVELLKNSTTSNNKNWRELLKVNLDKISMLNINEKSKIRKIIQKKQYSEIDQKELISILIKLKTEDLIKLFGKSFKEFSDRYVKWGKGWYQDLRLKKIILNNYLDRERENNLRKESRSLQKNNSDYIKICSIILKNINKGQKELTEILSKDNLKQLGIDTRRFNKHRIKRLIWLISRIIEKNSDLENLIDATKKKYNIQRRAARLAVMEILKVLNSIDSRQFDLNKYKMQNPIERVRINTEDLRKVIEKLKSMNWTITKLSNKIGANLTTILSRGDRIKKESLNILNKLIKKENIKVEILPEQKKSKKNRIYVQIDLNKLKQICKELNEIGLSNLNISKIIESRIDSILARNLKMPKSSFKKLNQLYFKKCKKRISKEYYVYDNKLVTKIFEENDALAQLCCILLGDGNLNEECLRITLNRIDEEDYVKYVRNFLKNFFQLQPNEYIHKKGKGIKLIIYGVAIVKGLELKGLKKGNKVKNQVSVPLWITKSTNFIKSGLKGLFDTDGTILLDKRIRSLQLSFSSDSILLAESFKAMCNKLNIKSSNVSLSPRKSSNKIKYRVLISAKKDVKKFLILIKPEKMNEKYRRIYLGTNLIYLKSSKEKIKVIKNKIKKDFPKPSQRVYSKAFSLYLKNMCEEILGYEISNEMIDRAISNSLEYKRKSYKNKKN